MAKKKLRNIVVDGKTYYWSFRPGYQRTDDPANPFCCHDLFTVYAETNHTKMKDKEVFVTLSCPTADIARKLKDSQQKLSKRNSEAVVSVHYPKKVCGLTTSFKG